MRSLSAASCSKEKEASNHSMLAGRENVASKNDAHNSNSSNSLVNCNAALEVTVPMVTIAVCAYTPLEDAKSIYVWKCSAMRVIIEWLGSILLRASKEAAEMIRRCACVFFQTQHPPARRCETHRQHCCLHTLASHVSLRARARFT